MSYRRCSFKPFIEQNRISLRFSDSIMGFLNLPFKISHDTSKFENSQIDQLNSMIQQLNYQLQKIYCEKKRIQNKVYFSQDLEFLRVLNWFVFLAFIICFYLLDDMIVTEDVYLKGKLWIPTIVILSIVSLVSLTFLYKILFVKRETIKFKHRINETVKNFLEGKEKQLTELGVMVEYFKFTSQKKQKNGILEIYLIC